MSTGAWAEAVQLGAQPGISADRITPVELAPGEYLRDWEQRYLTGGGW